MDSPALEGSSLFQLNVLTWATLPQPSSAPAKPILRNLGYSLFSIEQPLPVGIGQRESLQAQIPPVSIAPVADALLENGRRSHYVVIECKSSSFGIESGQTRQARGLILAGSEIMQRGLPIPEGSAEVAYLVPEGDMSAMEATLIALKGQVEASNTQVCHVGVIGVAIRQDGVYLVAAHEARGGGTLPRHIAPERLVLGARVDEDPRPLYIVPWIPESRDEDLDALREKLRAQLLSHVGRSPIGDVTLRFDDLLDDVSRRVYGLWRDRQSLQGQVNATVGSIVGSLTEASQAVIVRAAEMVLSLGSEEERGELMEHIRVADVPPRLTEGRQLPFQDTSEDD